MSEFFDSLMTGLHEAVAIERGELQGLRPKAFPNGQAVQLQCRAERKNGAFRYPHPKTMHIQYRATPYCFARSILQGHIELSPTAAE